MIILLSTNSLKHLAELEPKEREDDVAFRTCVYDVGEMEQAQ